MLLPSAVAMKRCPVKPVDSRRLREMWANLSPIQDLRRCMLTHFSCVRLCAMLRTIACQLFMGFSRQEYWSVLLFPSPGDLPNPGIETASLASPALAGRFFTTSATWEVPVAEPHWAQLRTATSQLTHRDRNKKMLEIYITEFRSSMLCSISAATMTNKDAEPTWEPLDMLKFKLLNLV